MLSRITIIFTILLNIACTKNISQEVIRPRIQDISLSVTGMTCSKCQNKLTRELTKIPNVENVVVTSLSGPNNVIITAPKTDLIMKQITSTITKLSYILE